METLKSLPKSKYFRPVLIGIVVLVLVVGSWQLYRVYQANLRAKRAVANRRPTAAFVAVKNKQLVTGGLPIEVRASDRNGIKQVSIYIDNKRIKVDTAKPYCVAGEKPKDPAASASASPGCLDWDSKAIGNGTHKLLATIEDKLGAMSRIQVAIEVKN